MSKPVLDIRDLRVEVDHKEILHGLDLHIEGGSVHAIMGPNGTGKSTLASSLMGHPRYDITGGTVTLNGTDLLSLSVDERARAGLFLAMQYPAEVSGVTNADFLRTAVNARGREAVGLLQFRKQLNVAVGELEMRESLPERYLNEGFSGGEKKRNEILQMKMLKPAVAVLDEIDSGLDIDALRIVGQNITEMVKNRGEEMALLMITHYQRLLDYVRPDYVHVLMNGRIVHSGGPDLAERLERDGYDWLRDELGIACADDVSGQGAGADDLDALFQ